MSGLTGETFKKRYFIFSSYCPLQIWPLKLVIKIHVSQKLCQLIDDEYITW